jgi:hypothetical protein
LEGERYSMSWIEKFDIDVDVSRMGDKFYLGPSDGVFYTPVSAP